MSITKRTLMSRLRWAAPGIAAALLFGGCAQAAWIKTGDAAETETGNAAETETGDAAETEAGDASEAEITEATREIFAMDTYMTITAYADTAETAVEAAVEEIERLDALLSTGDADSEVAQINSAGGGVLSEDTAYLLERALEIGESTGGVFDIAIYPVMEAWGFTDDNYRVPSEEEILELLPLISLDDIQYDEETKELSFGQDGMKIDFGGIAKGYTSGRIADIFRENGVESGLINLGGNVQVVGAKTDGSAWRVAIQNPEAEEDYIGVLSVTDRAVITSGGYERYFEEDGVRYHHIIDPATGYPADSGLVSVTIVSADGTLADGLSTSLFIMGEEKAAAYWQDHADEFDAILEDEDGVLYVTEGIAEDFTSDRETRVIEEK